MEGFVGEEEDLIINTWFDWGPVEVDEVWSDGLSGLVGWATWQLRLPHNRVCLGLCWEHQTRLHSSRRQEMMKECLESQGVMSGTVFEVEGRWFDFWTNVGLKRWRPVPRGVGRFSSRRSPTFHRSFGYNQSLLSLLRLKKSEAIQALTSWNGQETERMVMKLKGSVHTARPQWNREAQNNEVQSSSVYGKQSQTHSRADQLDSPEFFLS